MVTQWMDFVASTAGGACAFVVLFEGTRRLRRYGTHRMAIAMAILGAFFFLAYAGASYWMHVTLKEMAQVLQRQMFADELPADWGKDLDPEKRELVSVTMAQMAFVESGRLRHYFDRSGERKRYSPTEEDVKKRDFAVVTQTRLDDAVRTNYGDTFVWLIWGAIAVCFGLGMARDKAPLPANTTPHTDARDVPALASGSDARAGGRER